MQASIYFRMGDLVSDAGREYGIMLADVDSDSDFLIVDWQFSGKELIHYTSARADSIRCIAPATLNVA